MKFTIDFDPATATAGVTVPTVEGQPTQGASLNAGAFAAPAEIQSPTTETRSAPATMGASLNAGAFSANRGEPQAPSTSRESKVVSIAQPPPPHADDFGLAPRIERSEGTADAGPFKAQSVR